MTPGNNGASTPEDDDPFGYLYADGQARGAQPPSGGYGYPNSVSRVRAVGERQYGQQGAQGQTAPYAQAAQTAPTAQYGQQTAQQPQGAFSPSPHYQAPETLPGGGSAGSHRQYAGGGRGRGGPNNKGLLIGAIAVVAAVVIGIGVAMIGGGDDDTAGTDPTPVATASQGGQPSASATQNDAADDQADLPKADAKTLALAGGATTASDVTGAKADGGVYVGGFNQVGSSVTWTVNGIKSPGKYTLHTNYGVPGVDANATLTVNGKAQTTPMSLKNWAGAKQGDWQHGWTTTYNYITLSKGTNVIKVSCEQGNQCNVNLDQFWLEKGWPKK